LSKIAAGFVSFFPVAVGVEDLSTFADSACPPDGGIPNGRAQLEDLAGIDKARILIEHSGDGRADDRYIALAGLLFHFFKHRVALWQQAVEIFFNFRISDIHQEIVSPGFIVISSTERLAALSSFPNSSAVPVSMGKV